MIENYYLVFRNSLGVVDAVNEIETGASLPYNLVTKKFDETHPLVIALREWEAENEVLDLSDRPITPATLESAKLAKQREIIEIAKIAQTELVEDYAPAEQASWDKKLAQAEAILVSKDIKDAPILAIEAKAVSGAESSADILRVTLYLANKIKSKSEQLYAVSAQIAGQRTRLYNLVQTATTIEEVQKIFWNATN